MTGTPKPIPTISRSSLAALVTSAGIILGCTSGDARPAQVASKDTLRTDSAAGLVVPPSDPYTVGHAGTASITFTVPKDTIGPPVEQGSCEVAADPPPTTRDALIWVDGIREGKPLPRERRYQLLSSGCALSPRIQAVAIGGGINVYNDDKVLHTLVFIRAGTNDTLQTMPFTNDNEIVATNRLTKTAGIVEVRCTRHPQERAYIGVFDNPYFAVGSPGETITIDGLPEGDYQVLSWREGMPAPTSVPVKVGTTGQTEVVMK
jgi:hypothetical protein